MATGNVENIKERLSIEEVVSQYVELKPAGSSLKGRCPFHPEKTPSFMVSPARQTYHCFGCGVGGDIFTFVQEIEGLDFKGALTLLAERAGITLVFEREAGDKDATDTLYSILEAAATFYEVQGKDATDAWNYLRQRGLEENTIKSFRIGFAPDSWDSLLTHLKGKGFIEKDIEQAGLIKVGHKGMYDRFRSRIMFPIHDSVGRVVAFTGRIFGKEDDPSGKYINSPETTLYHKSKILYGYDRARQAIRKRNFAVLVEGQMDLIAAHQAGYTNTVALSGTALTPEHLTLLGRMSKNLCIALDADSAGIKSAGKSAQAALRAGFDVKIVALPEGKDPSDILAGGNIDAWKEYVRSAKHVVDFLLGYHRLHAKDDRSFKLTVQKEVLPYLQDIENEIDKSHFIQRVAAQLSVHEEAIRQELSKMKKTPQHAGIAAQSAKAPEQDTSRAAEEELVLMYLWQQSLPKPLVDLQALEKQIETALTPIGYEALKERLKTNSRAAFTFEALYHDEVSMKRAIHELLDRLTKRELQKEVEAASMALRKAESEGDEAGVAQYEQKYHELLGRLRQLDNHL